MKRTRGQTTLEYAVLMIIIMGGLLTISLYFKRGLQGRWRESVDDMGEQYDPRYMKTDIKHIYKADIDTRIYTMADPARGGYWTYRQDNTNAEERTEGYRRTGSAIQ